jgi:hypothetical protein
MPDLLKLWLDMLSVAGQGRDDEFRKAQVLFTGWYKKADNATQGDFHARLAASHRDWANIQTICARGADASHEVRLGPWNGVGFPLAAEWDLGESDLSIMWQVGLDGEIRIISFAPRPGYLP